MAQVTFNSETAVKELSYESLEDLNNKYLYIGVTIIESTGKLVFPLKLSLGKYLLSFICEVVSDSFTAPRTAAHQAPLSMEFSRQE